MLQQKWKKGHNLLLFYKTGSTLRKLWQELRSKFMMIRSKAQKAAPSGAGAQDVSQNDWVYYDSLRFLEKFLKARDIISSNQLRSALAEKRPEQEEFSKKRQATKEQYDKEYQDTSKLFALAVNHFVKPNEQQVMPVRAEKNEEDGFLQAVLEAYDALKEEDKFHGFMLAMSEIKNLEPD